MTIEKRWTVEYKDVKIGQVFECWGKIFIKVYDLKFEKGLIVGLEAGHAETEPSDDMPVTLYENAKVVLI